MRTMKEAAEDYLEAFRRHLARVYGQGNISRVDFTILDTKLCDIIAFTKSLKERPDGSLVASGSRDTE